MSVLRTMVGAAALAGLLAPASAAAWTRPSVLVTGDGTALLGAVARSDGSLRTAIVDEPRAIALGFVDGGSGDPLVAMRPPTLAGPIAFAADGSGVTLAGRRREPSGVVAFDAAGTVQPPVALDYVGSGPAVAISPGGTAVVAWVAKSPQGFEVDAAFRDPGTTTFSAPVRAGFTAYKRALVSAGIGDTGEAVVAWQSDVSPSDLAAAVRLPGAGFSPARFVSRKAGDTKLAVGPGGQAILATTRGAGLDVSIKPPGADAMPSAQRIDRGQGYAVDVAAAGPRTVAAAWAAAPRLGQPARVRVFEGDGRLRRVGTVGRDSSGEYIRLAVDGAGTTVVAWEEGLKAKRGDPTARTHLGVAYRPAGSRFGAPRHFGPVSLFSTPEAVQLGPAGQAWVLWEAYASGDSGGDAYRRVYVTRRVP